MNENRLRKLAGLNEVAGDEKMDFITKPVAKALGVSPNKVKIKSLSDNVVRYQIITDLRILKKAGPASNLVFKDPDGKRTWRPEIIDIRIEPERSHVRFEIQFQTSQS